MDDPKYNAARDPVTRLDQVEQDLDDLKKWRADSEKSKPAPAEPPATSDGPAATPATGGDGPRKRGNVFP